MDKAKFSAIVERSFGGERLTKEEALALWYDAPLDLLMEAADRLRRQKVADPEVVTWQIDRNVNSFRKGDRLTAMLKQIL